ncbi:Ku protein [Granulicella sp. 5B5]|uniref:non-homologous end joining protein Ku n=1 Tax=Granulicella sp. 5B5 TaxID=1617967 RepID=UPI0015F69417|nr:Ku protein [Granulicella sp. 5B5]QMV17894.1 Ku protein [Granulicella sp. 5B5]
MPRPFWSGQIQISLVSFGIQLFPAVEARSEIRFHQLSRKTGERIHHQKVAGDPADGDVIEKDDIVKGYEYRKGEYITIEPSEIEHLRIPSRHTLVVSQFVALDDLNPELFEKPYFVVPDGENQTEPFTVIRKALQSTQKAAIGKIAFGGREHLVAIAATPEAKDNTAAGRGMMAYTLRYAEELRDPAEYFSEIKKTTVDADQLSLAKELIQRKASKFAPEKFHDEYESALRELVEAKVNHAPLPKEKAAPRSGKVINLMDALRKSVKSGPLDEEAPARRRSIKKTAKAASKKGPILVKPTSKSVRSRKIA